IPMSQSSLYLYLLHPLIFYLLPLPPLIYLLFFFNDPATTEIYTLSLHDALPISGRPRLPPRARALRRELRRHRRRSASTPPMSAGGKSCDSWVTRWSMRCSSSCAWHASVRCGVPCLPRCAGG